MNHAATWDEYGFAYQTTGEHMQAVKTRKERAAQSMTTFLALASGYVNHGWADYVIEDGNDELFAPKAERKNGFSIEEAVRWMAWKELPFRITRAVHCKGSGILANNRKRVVIEKPKTTVWFINFRPADPRTPEKVEEMRKNLRAGIPHKLAAHQYGFSVSTVADWCAQNGLKKTNMKDE